MVFRALMMSLVDRDCGVNNLRLDCLLMDDWLYSLVNVVVYMLADYLRGSSSGVSSLVGLGCVGEATEFSLYTRASFLLVVMSEFFLHLWCKVVGVLLWEDLLVRDGLNSGVVVILVNLPIYCFGSFLMSVGLDGLRCNSRVNDFVHISAMTGSAGDFANCRTCCVHVC